VIRTGTFTLSTLATLSLLSLTLTQQLHAYDSIYDRSPSTEDILNHRNRKLAPPPRNIKSDRFDPSERFEVALERSENAVSLSDREVVQGSSSSNYEVLLGTNRKIRDKSVSLGVMGGGLAGVVGAKLDVARSYTPAIGVFTHRWVLRFRYRFTLPTDKRSVSNLPFLCP
jgi:hypothetical protein